jgi:hypothetical protein
MSCTDPSAINLTIAALAAQLPDDFMNLSEPSSTDRMAPRQQTTARIDGRGSAEACVASADEAQTVAGACQTEVFV